MTTLSRDVTSAGQTFDAIRNAHEANDLNRWNQAHVGLEHHLVTIRKDLERARAREADASAEVQCKLADLEATFAELAARSQDLQAPLGWSAVSRESEILRVLKAPVEGDTRVGFAQKEQAIKDELARLPLAESRTLLSRLQTSHTTDPIAVSFAQLATERRSRLISFLENARQREAVTRHGPPSPHDRAVSPAGPADSQHSAERSKESRADAAWVESQLLQMIETEEPDRAGLAAIDGTTRRALARRLETYRQGSGDALAARFARLDRATRSRLLDAISNPGATALQPTELVSGGEAQNPSASSKTASSERVELTASAKTNGATAAPSKPDVAWAYLRANESNFLTAITTRLRTLAVLPNPKVTWQASGFSLRFSQALSTVLADEPLFIKLPELVYPADPWYSIDLHRSIDEGTPGVTVDGKDPAGPMTWNLLAGEAVATDVQRALTSSLARMVPRFLVQLDEKAPQPIAVSDLVTSHPMDRVTAELLCDRNVVRPKITRNPHEGRPVHKTNPGEFREGVRFLENWRWLGSTDPKLWNWIEVKEPQHATAEDVAATLWLDPSASQYAYGITAAGPYFRIAPQWARKFSPDAQYARADAREDTALDLASSTLATDAAIAQAAGEKRVDKHGHTLPAERPSLAKILERSARQLNRAKLLLDPAGLWELVLPALNWVTRYQDGIIVVSDELAAELAPAIEGQSGILFEAVGAIVEVADIGELKAMQGPNNPVLAVLRQYAIAVGESHLVESARAQIDRAHRAKVDLPLALLELSASDTSAAAKEFAGSGHAGYGDDTEFMLDIDRRRIADMRAKQAAGEKVDQGSLAYVAASVKERAVDTRAKMLRGELMDLINYARDSKFGAFETMASFFDSDVRSLPDTLLKINADLDATVITPHSRAKETDLLQGAAEATKAALLARITQTTESNFADFVKRWDLKTRMANATAAIAKQEQRTAIIRITTQILLLIGASVVGGIAGNMVAGAVRGALIADAATASFGMMRAANVVGTVAGLTVDAGINASAQVVIQGGGWKEAFLGNFLASSAMRVALTPLQHAAQTWGVVGEETRNLTRWEKTARGFKLAANAGAELTIGMITASATDYVVQRIYHSDEPPTEKQAIDWAIQGASMAIGSFVGKWAHGFESHLVQLAETHGQLLTRSRRIRALAMEVEAVGGEHAALDLLVQRQQALQEESTLIEALAADPSSPVKPSTLEALRAGNRAERADVTDAAFATAPMRLAGLVPDDASGRIWTGHRGQIDLALEQSQKAGISVEVKAHERDTWKVEYNHQEITILETKIEGPVILAGDDADIAEVAARVKPLAGTLDVVVHGTVDDLIVELQGKELHIDHRALATYIRKSGASFEKVRLLACNSGQHPKGVAQHLANKLGMTVIAPSDVLWIGSAGELTVGPHYERNTGTWIEFQPSKSSSRYTKAVERTPSPRAIDRYREAKRVEATEPEFEATHESSAEHLTVEDKRSELDRGAVKLGSQGSTAIREVEDLAIDSELQMSAGIGIGDPLFGPSLATALEAAATNGRNVEVASFQKQTRRLQAQLLEALRDPSLSAQERQAELGRIVDKAANHFSDNADLLRGFDAQSAIAKARKAIVDDVAEAFTRKMTLDRTGIVHRGGEQLGSFRSLVDNVVEANRELIKAGIARELIISVSETRTALREVLVLERARDVHAQGKHGNAEKLPIQDGVDPNGVIIDVGAGESSFGIDLVQAKDRAGGPLIQAEYGPSIFDGSRTRSDLTWEHAIPRTDENSAVVLGDPLQTMDVMFGEHGVKRVFINNVNAHYDEAAYWKLAAVLTKAMTHDGRVEVQWTDDPEFAGQPEGSRGHIEGPALAAALQTSDRTFDVKEIEPELHYDYSTKPSTRKGGVDPSKNRVPTKPIPKFRWIFTFK